MRLNPVAGLLLALLAGCASTPPSPSQKMASPMPIAGPTSGPARNAALASITAAIESHEYRQAIVVESAWVRDHPADLDFRHVEPMLYLLAGDHAGWEHARSDILQSWAQLRGKTQNPVNPSFTVDMMKVGKDIIIADQCYERAGRFGVIYRFTVVGPDQHVHSFFTVESAEADNNIARELGSSRQVFSLDHFRPGIHETVAMLPGLPAYADLRQRVLDYSADPSPISASSNGQPGLSTEGCTINRPGTRS